MNGESERLGPVAQALVESGRASDAPTDDDRARVRLRLTAALGVSALSVVGTQAAAASLAVEGAAGAAVNGASMGAGAAAGNAVAGGGGLFAALGSKVLVASVLAATAVGGAVGTQIFLSLERAQPPLRAAAQSGLSVSSTAAQSVASAARPTPAAAPLNPLAAASGAATPGGTRTATASAGGVAPRATAVTTPAGGVAAPERHAAASRQRTIAATARATAARGTASAAQATTPTTIAHEIGRNAVERANDSKAQLSASRPAPSADARATTTDTIAAAAAPASEAEAPSSNASVPAPSPSAAASDTESARGAAPAPATGPDSSAAATAPAASPLSAAAASQPSVVTKPPALSGELKLLASAQHALRDNQLPRALELLNQHAARYPAGALRPERCAARAVVFCRMGEKNLGRAEVQKLEAETPTSPLVRWAKDVCGLR